MTTQFSITIPAIQSSEDQAGRRSMETLLNCFCREVAVPAGQVELGFGQADVPMALHALMAQGAGRVLQIRLPKLDTRLAVLVEKASMTSNFRYRSLVFRKQPEEGWTPLSWKNLAQLLLNDLAVRFETPFNLELLQQIYESVSVTSRILASKPKAAKAPNSVLNAYLESEQSLLYGHPFHPAPKSRQGFSTSDLEDFSPELGAQFALHYFAVRREFLMQQALDGQTSCEHVVAEHAPAVIPIHPEFALVPCHPWQARYLLAHPLVGNALTDGRLQNLGQLGPDYFATSSLRTVFHPVNPYFYKFSLNVRITNCVRKNAHYELQGALHNSRILRDEAGLLNRQFPSFQVLLEPAFMSIDFNDSDREANCAVIEGFGMILREAFVNRLEPSVTPLLAGYLFGNHVPGRLQLRQLLQQTVISRGLSLKAAATQWFAAYAQLLARPVLFCLFERGIVFEPHLQNVLIGIKNSAPCQIFIRDFEGVKLIPGHSGHHLEGLPERVRQGLAYTQEQGWNRIAYCLLVNNFCEAIHQFDALLPGMERELWSIVRDILSQYLRQFGQPASKAGIEPLLRGQAIPCKANLVNRFHRRPDREAGYLSLPNPLPKF